MRLRDANIGDRVEITLENHLGDSLYQAYISEKDDSIALLGWKSGDDIFKGAWENNGLYDKKYSHCYWVCLSTKCTLIQPIFIPNQVCIDCKRDAPHAKPNLKDKYLCISCKVLREL